MNDKPANIYAHICYDIPPKLADYIGELNLKGQIDKDEHGNPYVVKVDEAGSNYQVFIVRNGKLVNFILNTRKRRPPVISWDNTDGFTREDHEAQTVVMPKPVDQMSRKERSMKRTYESLVEQILRS